MVLTPIQLLLLMLVPLVVICISVFFIRRPDVVMYVLEYPSRMITDRTLSAKNPVPKRQPPRQDAQYRRAIQSIRFGGYFGIVWSLLLIVGVIYGQFRAGG